MPSVDDINSVFVLIRKILEGRDKRLLATELETVIKRYPYADSVVLACTELPLLVPYLKTDLPLYDTLQILAQTIYEKSK